jgi:hypothetical protein
LFLSIAAGLCISSFSRRNEIAGRTTLGLLAALLGLPLLFADGPFSFLRLFSAWTAFQTISDEYFRLHPYDFASGTLVLQCLALTLMICAVCFLPTRWGLPIEASSRSLRKRLVVAWHTFVEHAFPELRDSLNRLRNVQGRSAILDRNPGEWLAVREGVNYLEQVPFLIALVILALIAASGSATGPTPTPALWAVIGSAVLLLARLASQASFPLCNMRRSGAVEMLLSTPLDPWQIVTGQVAALRQQFTIPSIIVLAGGFFYAIRASGGPFEGVFGFLMLGFIMMVWTVSIGALGLFIGLLEKSPATAFFQTILIGIFVAGPISMLSTPFPIAFLFLLGFSGNRLTSPDLVRLLKRQPYARKAALA